MSYPKRVYQRLLRAIFFGLTLVLVIMGLFSKRGFLDWRRMVRQNEELRARIEQVQAQRAELDHHIQMLARDPAEQERVVRQSLGLVKPNELVIEFD